MAGAEASAGNLLQQSVEHDLLCQEAARQAMRVVQELVDVAIRREVQGVMERARVTGLCELAHTVSSQSTLRGVLTNVEARHRP